MHSENGCVEAKPAVGYRGRAVCACACLVAKPAQSLHALQVATPGQNPRVGVRGASACIGNRVLLGAWVRRSLFYKLLPLVPPEFEAQAVDTFRTWKVTLLHHDGRARPLSIGVTVDTDVRIRTQLWPADRPVVAVPAAYAILSRKRSTRSMV